MKNRYLIVGLILILLVVICFVLFKNKHTTTSTTTTDLATSTTATSTTDLTDGNSVSLTCTNGSTALATYYQSDANNIMQKLQVIFSSSTGTITYDMTPAMSASGAKFSTTDGNYSFWEHRNEYTLYKNDDPITTCSQSGTNHSNDTATLMNTVTAGLSVSVTATGTATSTWMTTDGQTILTGTIYSFVDTDFTTYDTLANKLAEQLSPSSDNAADGPTAGQQGFSDQTTACLLSFSYTDIIVNDNAPVELGSDKADVDLLCGALPQ